MRARLLCRAGRFKGKDFEITGKLTIGRTPDNSVVLPSRLISGEHAQIVFDGDQEQYYLEDLDSLNGTALDGIPVRGRERLDRLHVVTFGGSFDFIWQGIDLCGDLADDPTLANPPTVPIDPAVQTAVDEVPPTLEDLGGALAQEAVTQGTWSDADAVALPAALAGLEAAANPSATPAEEPSGSPDFVLLVTLEDRMHRIHLQAGENLVGRQAGAEILIDSSEISRRHAVLTVSGSKVRLRDEGSRNHTYVEGELVVGEIEVKPGSEVRFGIVEAILVLKD